MIPIVRRAGALLLIAALTGCAGHYRHSAKDTSAPKATEEAYTLAIGDKVNVNVFEDQGMSGEYLLNDNGTIVLPLVGEIAAAGKTQSTLQQDLTAKLSQGFLVNPHVTVKVISLRPFYILGEVNKPGAYEYTPSLNAFKAIAIAGGFTARASQDRYIIMRGTGTQTREIDAIDTTPILPGDAIRVTERFF